MSCLQWQPLSDGKVLHRNYLEGSAFEYEPSEDF